MTQIRAPICSVLGHVDHGKSSLLDAIRESNIVAKEAGGITQAIGASIIPLSTIQKICGPLLDKLQLKFSIPGLLFIDTPGHAAFTNLRKRGGNLADIAIVVVDINEGFKPQTFESIDILRSYKTPFIIALNKLDLLQGYEEKSKNLLENFNLQSSYVQQLIDQKIYEVVGQLYEKYKMNTERYDRVDDYTKQVAIVPCSAKTRAGIPELLMVLTGLAQKFLEQNLNINPRGPAQGIILEIKEETGLGKTLDVIIYDGRIALNDTIVIGGVEQPIVTRVKALFEPAPLSEMRDRKTKYNPVQQAIAATGIKIVAPDIENVIAGMPLVVPGKNLEEAKKKVQEEVNEVAIQTDKNGVIIKADSLGSLEALTTLLKEKNIPIRKATVGPIMKKDYSDAEANYEQDPLQAVILGFNIPEAESTDKVKILTSDVIYRLIIDYTRWVEEEKRRLEEKELENLVRPCKLEFLRNCSFRASNPAILGVEVLRGTAKNGIPLMKTDGKPIGKIASMQLEKENVAKAEKGTQLAISLLDVTIGRQVQEGDVFYSAIPEEDFRKIKTLKKYLKPEEIEVLKEIAQIKRKENMVWGV
ncbi:MAG TPA: translation initiation factor IF-2 [Candidatus Nanoarchaeia archaeon]|nr:translation initiation factor IF-2 [Candidatus Nanoarchaeia archaeon]